MTGSPSVSFFVYVSLDAAEGRSPDHQDAYRLLMKHGLEPTYWSEYVLEAYVNHLLSYAHDSLEPLHPLRSFRAEEIRFVPERRNMVFLKLQQRFFGQVDRILGNGSGQLSLCPREARV